MKGEEYLETVKKIRNQIHSDFDERISKLVVNDELTYGNIKSLFIKFYNDIESEISDIDKQYYSNQIKEKFNFSIEEIEEMQYKAKLYDEIKEKFDY
jgi:hypothetical protein